MRRWLLLAASVTMALVGVCVIGFNLGAGDDPAPLPDSTWSEASPSAQPTPSTPVDSGEGPVTADTMKPNRILIPALGVYASIVDEPVAGGGLQLPEHTKVARYDGGGTVTSTTGTLLLAGHVSSYGQPGALKWLSKLQPGDWVYVTDSAGNRGDYIASAMDVKLKESLPQDVFDDGGPVRAVLVTCGGKVITRDDGSRHYDSNVIVYLDRAAVHTIS